ncbi:hypothetical protein THAOC_28914, partial [Thalassiosira oceanica]
RNADRAVATAIKIKMGRDRRDEHGYSTLGEPPLPIASRLAGPKSPKSRRLLVEVAEAEARSEFPRPSSGSVVRPPNFSANSSLVADGQLEHLAASASSLFATPPPVGASLRIYQDIRGGRVGSASSICSSSSRSRARHWSTGLELVDATTKQPFKGELVAWILYASPSWSPSAHQHSACLIVPETEHLSATGECYVEVEPIKFKVDGVDLGCKTRVTKPIQDKLFGSWERKSEMSQMTALRFKLARLAKPEEGMLGGGHEVTGRVEMEVYKLGPVKDMKEKKECKPDTSTALEQSFQTKTGGKKCIMSTQGTTTLVTKRKASKKSVRYATGPLLQTVTLNYCTAAGLVLNKILGPPPKEKEEEDVDIERPRKRVKPEKKRRSGDVKPDVVDLTNPFIDKKKPGPPETIDLT